MLHICRLEIGAVVRYSIPLLRAHSSVGQSGGLIILWSQVRALLSPPNVEYRENIVFHFNIDTSPPVMAYYTA